MSKSLEAKLRILVRDQVNIGVRDHRSTHPGCDAPSLDPVHFDKCTLSRLDVLFTLGSILHALTMKLTGYHNFFLAILLLSVTDFSRVYVRGDRADTTSGPTIAQSTSDWVEEQGSSSSPHSVVDEFGVSPSSSHSVIDEVWGSSGSSDAHTDAHHGMTSPHCHCLTEFPDYVTCSTHMDPEYDARLREAEREVARLRRLVDEYNETTSSLLDDLELVETQLNVTQETLQHVLDGTVVITVVELEVFQNDLKDMSLVLDKVEKIAGDLPEVQELREELDNLTRTLHDLHVTAPNEMHELHRQIDELKAKLAECERSLSEISKDDEIFQPWNDFPSQDSCRDVIYVSEPFTVRMSDQDSGVWFRDPVPENYPMVYYSPFYNIMSLQLDRFANVADFRDGSRYESQFLLPRDQPAQGTGMVVYNGSLYYHPYRTQEIVRYHLENQTVAASVQLPDAVVGNDGSYTRSRFTDIDLAVDEFGVWAIYAAQFDNAVTVVERFDPVTLATLEFFAAPFAKQSAGDCFIVCAKLYCTTSHAGTSVTVQSVYDLRRDEFRVLELPFDIRYGRMTSLDYNPRDQKLYGWDHGHQVVYDLTFDPQHETQHEPQEELRQDSSTTLLPSDSDIPLDYQ